MSIIGVDVSKYNLGWNPDNAKKPIDFVIQRAGYGGFYGNQVKDESFDVIHSQVNKIPVRGAYWYYSSHSNWKIQADFFLNVIKNKDFHFYCVDYEKAYNTLNARTTAELSEFIRYIKEQTGKKCLVYFSPSIYNEFIKPAGYTSWLNKQDIWIAQYPYSIGQTPLATKPNMSSAITSWKFWQYGAGDVNFTAGRNAGSDYGGGTVGIDLNYFNGSMDDLYVWADVTETIPPPTPDPEPIPDPTPTSNPNIVKTNTNLNIRENSGTSYQILGSLPVNSTVTILKFRYDVSNNIWGNVNGGWICLKLGNVYYSNKRLFNDVIIESYVPPVVVIPPTIVKSNIYIFNENNYYYRRGNGPLILSMSKVPKIGDKILLLNQQWQNFVYYYNTKIGIEKIKAVDYGPSQGINDNGFLKYIGALWPGRNIVKIDSIVTGLDGEKWGVVKGIPFTTPDNTKYNKNDNPELLHTMFGGTDGRYFPLTNTIILPIIGNWYVQMKWLVSVDTLLPKTVKVISSLGINIRDKNSVDGNIVGKLNCGESVKIYGVSIGKSGLWGMIESNKYIALRYNDQNFTDWKI